MPLIRDARAEDAAGILPIYNRAVRETTAIWRDALSDLAGREEWLAARQAAGFPVLVAEVDAQVAGFASFGDFRFGDGYHLTVEHSVYVATEHHRLGIGRALMVVLIGRARAMDLHAMIGGIESGNAASIALHEALGFREVGRLPQVGTKFGRWLDLSLLQLTLDDRPTPCSAP